MTVLATYPGFGLPLAEIVAHTRAEAWGWDRWERPFRAYYLPGDTCPVPRAA